MSLRSWLCAADRQGLGCSPLPASLSYLASAYAELCKFDDAWQNEFDRNK